MSYTMDQTANQSFGAVANESQSTQKSFLIKTYSHLVLGIMIFAATIFTTVNTPVLLSTALSLWRLPLAGLVIMAILIATSFVASWLANNSQNVALHYVGLLIYGVMEGFITVPLVFAFLVKGAAGIVALTNASILTVVIFLALTLVVMVTKPNLGFLGKFLAFGSIVAFGLVIFSALFVLNLGIWFTAAMITLVCGYILYETSQMLHNYNSKQYVACALSLLASITNLFWYILRLFGSRN
jgi:FtsH-binding integral membrane protein